MAGDLDAVANEHVRAAIAAPRAAPGAVEARGDPVGLVGRRGPASPRMTQRRPSSSPSSPWESTEFTTDSGSMTPHRTFDPCVVMFSPMDWSDEIHPLATDVGVWIERQSLPHTELTEGSDAAIAMPWSGEGPALGLAHLPMEPHGIERSGGARLCRADDRPQTPGRLAHLLHRLIGIHPAESGCRLEDGAMPFTRLEVGQAAFSALWCLSPSRGRRRWPAGSR